MKSTTLIAGLLATANTAFAHYRWTHLIANGTSTPDYYYVRANTVNVANNSPVTDVTSNDIRCGANTLGSAATTHVGTVAAGSVVGLGLDQAAYHQGPALLYMSKVTSDTTADGSSQWFKVAQLGPTFSPGSVTWPTPINYTFTIPKSIPSGQYLLRAEQIGLHVATAAGGAQFYLGCAQINVVGGGSGTPKPLVSFPGAYKATDPGILLNIYDPIPTSYTFPGPTVWSG